MTPTGCCRVSNEFGSSQNLVKIGAITSLPIVSVSPDEQSIVEKLYQNKDALEAL
jgi:hypothetical protein